jgi:hypothetical protein
VMTESICGWINSVSSQNFPVFLENLFLLNTLTQEQELGSRFCKFGAVPQISLKFFQHTRIFGLSQLPENTQGSH